MALARVKTWNPGDTLTATDLNAEFNNILNNPITLISPTTGVINFNRQVHTGFVPSAVSASSGTSGQFLIASTDATPLAVWSTPLSYISTSRHLAVTRYSNLGQATALTSANFSLSTGWGSSAVISAIGSDQAYTFTVTVGATVFANPTVTCTFADGNWQSALPAGVAQLVDISVGAFPTVNCRLQQNSSGEILTALFTPTTGAIYRFNVIRFG